MTRFVAACLVAAAAAVFGAPTALADPADLVPYCSGDQTPMDNNCRQMPELSVHPRLTGERPREPGVAERHQPGRPTGDLARRIPAGGSLTALIDSPGAELVAR